MFQKLANVLSVVFFPGLIPTYLIAAVYFTSPYVLGLPEIGFTQKLSILGFILLYTFIFPGILILWLKNRGFISSILLKRRQERLFPFLLTVALTYFLAWLFTHKAAELVPTGIVLIFIATVVLIIAIISIFWQVSAHAAGMGGFTGSLLTLALIYDDMVLKIMFFIALVLSGMVMSARLKLGAHSPGEVYVGFGIGCLIAIFGSFFI